MYVVIHVATITCISVLLYSTTRNLEDLKKRYAKRQKRREENKHSLKILILEVIRNIVQYL